MVDGAGIEPATRGFSGHSSTPELPVIGAATRNRTQDL